LEVIVADSTDSPLRVLRRSRGLSLRECAREAGIDPGHLSRAERGMAVLSVDTLARLARVLGLRELERLLALFEKAR
jgi:transcriptional regulator with XRE-family HTH domain